MSIKLLVLDLDDTTLNEYSFLSTRNLVALKEAGRAGVKIMLASGRPPTGMLRFAHEIGLEHSPGLMICFNGSTVLDVYTEKPVREITLAPEVSQKVYDLMTELNLTVQYYTETSIIPSKPNSFSEMDSKICNAKLEFVKDFRQSLSKPVVKMLVIGNPDELVIARKTLETELTGSVRILRSSPLFIEVMPSESDKGKALRWVAEKMNLDRDEIMAVGDGHNDLGMLAYAGHGTAVANAGNEVKEAARYNSQWTHKEDAIARLIEEKILNKRPV